MRLIPWLCVLVMLASACGPAQEIAVTTAVPTPVVVATRPPVQPDLSRPLTPPGDPVDPVRQAIEQTLPEDGTVDLALTQQALTALRYYDGPADGVAGTATTTALQAFQKVQGLTVDGQAGPDTIAALRDPVLPPIHQGDANRIDIDLDLQIMFVVLDGQLSRILPVSSGNGTPYDLPGGIRAESLTPVGQFAIGRQIEGPVSAYFGRLYNPMYFYKGWAIHGSNNVPATPASHGCVRIPVADAEWLFGKVVDGMTVNVYGEQNAFNPALGETAGTEVPAGDPSVPPPPPPPPPVGQSLGS